jgi:hypothetical protein
LIGFLPFDHQVVENDALGRPIWDLPEDQPVVRAAREVFSRIDAIREEKLGTVTQGAKGSPLSRG